MLYVSSFFQCITAYARVSNSVSPSKGLLNIFSETPFFPDFIDLNKKQALRLFFV